jgi:4-amino-4-deoxy-L-arabinose transferase-like glycosyltransferase
MDPAPEKTNLDSPDSPDSRHGPDSKERLTLKLSGLILVMITSCLVFFSGLGQYPLFNPDEALYAEPAREMLVTGQYVTTLLNYVVRYTKPPLCIWAMALSYKVFGVNEFAARFYSVACGVILVAAAYLMIARYVSTRAAVIGALSLVVAPLFVLTAREAITDMPLALFMAGSQMAFFHAFKARRFSFAIAAYVLLGLAVMTKGAYFQEFIVRENFQRFTAVVDKHNQPFWYHGAAMFAGYFPFSLYLPRICWAQLAKIMSLLRTDGTIWSRYLRLKTILLAQSESDDLYFYCFVWALFVLVFFSLSVSKLLPYTLPAFPAMAILVAGEMECAFVTTSFARLCYPLLAILLVYAGAGVVAPKLMLKAKSLPQGLSALIIGFAAVQTAVALLAILLGRLRFFVAGATLFAVISCAVFGVYLNKTLPVISAKLEGQLPQFAHFVGQSDLPIIVFDMRKPGVPFYALRRVENINGADQLRQRLSQIPTAYILTTVNKLEFLQSVKNTKVISQGGDYALVQFANADIIERK